METRKYNPGLAQCLSVCISMIHRQEEALLRAGSLTLSTNKKTEKKEEKVVDMMGQRGTSSRPRTLGAALPWSWVQGSLAVTCGAGRKENGLRGDGGYRC